MIEKAKNLLGNLPKGWPILAGILVLIIAIPVTLYLVRQQQITRSRATGSQPVSLAFEPASAQKAVGEEFDVVVKLSPGTLDVSGVDIKVTYDPSKLAIVKFTPRTTNFAPVGRVTTTGGQFNYAGFNASNEERRNSDFEVGTLRLKLVAPTANPAPSGFWPAAITFDSASKAVASRNSSPISTDQNQNGSYSPLVASPTPSPTPVAITCTNAIPEGLTDTNKRGPAGEKIFLEPTSPDNIGLQVSRTPATANISDVTSTAKPGQTGDNITPRRATGPGGNWVLGIAENTSTTADKEFTIATKVSAEGQTPVDCPAFIIRVQKAPALVACRYTETKVFVREPGVDQAWVRNKRLTINKDFKVAAFHDEGQFTDNFPRDIRILVTDADNQQFVINNVDNTSQDDDNNVSFKPTKPGRYVFSATTKGMERTPGCIDNSATVDVVGLDSTTTSVRVAESKGGLDTRGLFTEYAYTETPLTKSYTFKDKSLGDKHEIWVKFIGTGAAGEEIISVQGPFPITIVPPDPAVSTVSCDLGVDNTVRFSVKGSNFGAEQKRNGSLKTGQTALKIDSWSNTEVQATLEQTGTTGQSFPVILTRDDGALTDSTTCSVATSALQLGANFFCRQNLTQTLSNVEAVVAEGREGGNVAQETVTIGANGLITGLKTKLQQGRGYRIGIKAPGTLRKVVEFTAGRGTTKLGSLDLPVGDIFPTQKGDGKINSSDYAQLLRDWVTNAAAGARSGDLNSDGRVNSFDWACMRPYFNLSDDSEPEAGPLSITASPAPGSLTVVSPSPSASPTPSPGTGTSGTTTTVTTTVTTTSGAASPSPSPTASPTPTPSPSPSPGT